MHRPIQDRWSRIITIPLNTKVRITSPIIPSTLPILKLRTIRSHRGIISTKRTTTVTISISVSKAGDTADGVTSAMSEADQAVAQAVVVVEDAVVGDFKLIHFERGRTPRLRRVNDPRRGRCLCASRYHSEDSKKCKILY
mgnify:CR=1 FL=1